MPGDAICAVEHRGRLWPLAPADFIRFLRIACSSLNETKSHLGEVKVLNAMANDIRERCEELASRAAAATTAPIKSLGG